MSDNTTNSPVTGKAAVQDVSADAAQDERAATSQHDSDSQGEQLGFLKLLVEAGPLAVFFVCNAYAETLFGVSGNQKIFWATGAFMIATVIALTVSRTMLGRIPILPLISGVFVLGFGGLTLYLQNELFIKIKPTIVNLLFATLLAGGLYFKRPLLKYLLGDSFALTDRGWTLLTIRWALFFVFLAVLNEVVWRSFSTDFWAGFKFFGVMPITMVFAISQLPLIMKHQTQSAQS